MKMKMFTSLFALAVLSFAASAMAETQVDTGRDQSDVGKMFHKLGRGVTNILTCWVEIPRNVAREWEKTDPATGLVMGTVKGVGWTFARLATGAYETVSFPFPVPSGYQAMIEPEFVVTDVWGAPIPDLTELDSNDPTARGNSTTVHPERYRY